VGGDDIFINVGEQFNALRAGTSLRPLRKIKPLLSPFGDRELMIYKADMKDI
jgi:hypothetical protein